VDIRLGLFTVSLGKPHVTWLPQPFAGQTSWPLGCGLRSEPGPWFSLVVILQLPSFKHTVNDSVYNGGPEPFVQVERVGFAEWTLPLASCSESIL
jgi:hypothetical protein